VVWPRFLPRFSGLAPVSPPVSPMAPVSPLVVWPRFLPF